MSGADRTGLVATLYMNVYQHEPLQEAESQQLTWHYGHFSFGEAHPMDDFFRLYTRTGRGMDLRTWIKTRYPALYRS
jgi:hypothetical protein